jgi:hypothetical protein
MKRLSMVLPAMILGLGPVSSAALAAPIYITGFLALNQKGLSNDVSSHTGPTAYGYVVGLSSAPCVGTMSVPDGGATLMLLGAALIVLVLLRRRFRG